jgi:hypothetical protein
LLDNRLLPSSVLRIHLPHHISDDLGDVLAQALYFSVNFIGSFVVLFQFVFCFPFESKQVFMQLADVASRARERAFNLPSAPLGNVNSAFGLYPHGTALPQSCRSCSNEAQRFCAAYRKAGGDIDLVYIDSERRTGARPTSPRPAAWSPGW